MARRSRSGDRERRAAHRRGAAGLVAFVLVLSACGQHAGTGPSASTGSTASTLPPTTATTAPSTTTTAVPAGAGTWSLIPEAPQSNVWSPAGWTGTELVVSPVGCCGGLATMQLSAYNPSTGRWRSLPAAPLTPRNDSVGVWTGTELIVAGGLASPDGSAEKAAPALDGAAWVAASNSWHTIASMPLALSYSGQSTAVWTGTEMLVWSSQPETLSLGGTLPARETVMAYNPVTNRWRSLPPSGLSPRMGAAVVWTGRELVVWGGTTTSWTQVFGDGARLDPATDTWRPLAPAPVPARGQMAAVWDGHEMLIWGGNLAGGGAVGRGAAYSPSTDSWRALPLSPLRAKYLPAGLWTGRVFLVVGGAAGPTFPVPGPGAAAYDPATNRWSTLSPAPDYPAASYGPTGPADQRAAAIAVWTGRSALFAGGLDFSRQGPRSDGLAWTPAA